MKDYSKLSDLELTIEYNKLFDVSNPIEEFKNDFDAIWDEFNKRGMLDDEELSAMPDYSDINYPQ